MNFENFSFLFIAVLFSAGNAKKTETLKFILIIDQCMNFENFSFLFIAVLFSAGNVKKNGKHVFIVLIATIGGILCGHFVSDHV